MFDRVLNKTFNITLIRIIQRKILAEQKEIWNLQKKNKKKTSTDREKEIKTTLTVEICKLLLLLLL